MLVVQQHLRNGTETLESLYNRFGIHSKIKDNMVILDYDQILSYEHKDRNIVRECRGLVLENETWNIIAKSYNRFFNYLENSDSEYFNWNLFNCYEKVDGSIIRVCMYNGSMKVFTRFSFADQRISELYKKTWSEASLECLNDIQIKFIQDNPKYTYVFEFCSPYTQVVRYYEESIMIMTSIFDNQTGEEISENNQVYKDAKIVFKWADQYKFTNVDQIIDKLNILKNEQSSFEGFVVKDSNGIRLKIKNPYYLVLHRLSNNGNISNMKTLLPLVLSGEVDEVLVYFPYLEDSIDILQIAIEEDLEELRKIYKEVINIDSQKDFAIKLTKEFYTPYSDIFFRLRKEFGSQFTFSQVEEAFLGSTDLVLKVYKSRGILNDE
jgi:hypothetical protein